MDLEIVGKVEEAKQSTQAQYSQEVKRMQELVVEMERKAATEKKQIIMERDSDPYIYYIWFDLIWFYEDMPFSVSR